MKYTFFNISVHLIAAVILLGGGYYFGITTILPQHAVERIGEVNEHVSLIRFDRVESGLLMGEVEGKPARLITRGDVSVPDETGIFSLNLSELGLLATEVFEVDIPEGAQFVASKNGKKLYPFDSKAGKKIALKNRVYFVTKEEARAAGYR